MASLITHNLTYSKENIFEYVIKPLFIENDIRQLVTLRTGIKSREKLDYFDKLEKITKAYARGTSFTSSTGVTLTQKTLTVNDLKAQIEQNAKEFEDSVKQELLASGYKINDIAEADQILQEVFLGIYTNALKADFQRLVWFSDNVKETRSSAKPSGTADTNYNVFDGLWRILIDDVLDTTIPAAQFIDLGTTTYLNTAPVAQVATVTLTGTLGTGNITLNGVAYLATFDTDLTTTAAAFVSDHAATIAAREGNIVVTSSGAGVIFTSGIEGLGFTVSNNVNATGNLAGNAVATTANVATGTVKTDGALTAFRAMYAAMPNSFKAKKSEAKFMVTASLADNYRTTLETGAHDGAQSKLVDGVEKLYFRGIEIVEMLDWDNRIDADFDYYPHRALLTIPKNLMVGVDGEADDMDIESWYDQGEQLRYWRTEYKMGVEYIHPDYIVVAYA